MKNKLLIITVLVGGAFFLQSCSNSTNDKAKSEMDSSMSHMSTNDSKNTDKMQMDNDMMKSMSGTMGKMDNMKMSGDFDLDFANMMVIHHQAAIDMSEVEIGKGKDEQMITMAKNIIAAQKAEIEQMQRFVKNYKMPEKKMENGEMHNELGTTMKAMMDKMHGMQMTGNTDKDFAMMMIPHHESAVTMAEEEIGHGKQLELKKLAQKIIADQNKEINEFKAWLAEHK